MLFLLPFPGRPFLRHRVPTAAVARSFHPGQPELFQSDCRSHPVEAEGKGRRRRAEGDDPAVDPFAGDRAAHLQYLGFPVALPPGGPDLHRSPIARRSLGTEHEVEAETAAPLYGTGSERPGGPDRTEGSGPQQIARRRRCGGGNSRDPEKVQRGLIKIDVKILAF